MGTKMFGCRRFPFAHQIHKLQIVLWPLVLSEVPARADALAQRQPCGSSGLKYSSGFLGVLAITRCPLWNEGKTFACVSSLL